MRINVYATGLLMAGIAFTTSGLLAHPPGGLPENDAAMPWEIKPPASPKSSHDMPEFPKAPNHKRPLKVIDGKTLLWAGGDSKGGEGAIWFDMTDALVDPVTFQHGIGKDRIPSIDDPVFAPYGDEALAAARIGDETDVIGYAFNGVVKAYPLFILDRHEIVNDTFGDAHLGVYW